MSVLINALKNAGKMPVLAQFVVLVEEEGHDARGNADGNLQNLLNVCGGGCLCLNSFSAAHVMIDVNREMLAIETSQPIESQTSKLLCWHSKG